MGAGEYAPGLAVQGINQRARHPRRAEDAEEGHRVVARQAGFRYRRHFGREACAPRAGDADHLRRHVDRQPGAGGHPALRGRLLERRDHRGSLRRAYAGGHLRLRLHDPGGVPDRPFGMTMPQPSGGGMLQNGRPRVFPGSGSVYYRDDEYNPTPQQRAIDDAGVAREVARAVLPVGLFSSMYVTMNARALMNFLSLRTSREGSHFPSYPQREIEMVAEKMEEHFARLMPLTHAAFEKSGRVAP